jgi:ketosteroid isomerase-like protein
MKDSDTKKDRQNIIALIDREVKAVGEGDFETYNAILTDGAVFMPPDSFAKEGEELRRWLCDFLERFKVEWIEFVHGNVEVAGDLALHEYIYRWRVTPKDGGNTNVIGGKGIHIVRRQRNGSWKIAREIWNANPMPQNTVQ